MFYRSLVICVLLLQTLTSTSQVFSLEPALGLNACQVHGDSYNGYRKLGAFAGTCVNAKLSDKASLQLGFYFSQKGARHNPNFKTGDLSYYRLVLNYIDLPISLKYFLNSHYYTTLGPSIAYLFSYSEVIDYTNITGTYQFLPYEIGLNIALGRPINNKLNVELRCSNSISTVRSYGVSSNVFYPNPVARFFNKGFYNNILTLFVSYRIELNSKTSD